uniref:Uncharacterized protein n=1 Tax=Ciona savignyi TaxID=51511 RepID=H2YJ07_CIOSA
VVLAASYIKVLSADKYCLVSVVLVIVFTAIIERIVLHVDFLLIFTWCFKRIGHKKRPNLSVNLLILIPVPLQSLFIVAILVNISTTGPLRLWNACFSTEHQFTFECVPFCALVLLVVVCSPLLSLTSPSLESWSVSP